MENKASAFFLIEQFQHALKVTFPEFTNIINEKTLQEVYYEYETIILPKYEYYIQNSDESLFSMESENFIYLYPGICFKQIWNLQNVTTNSKQTLWKYIQSIYLAIKSSSNFIANKKKLEHEKLIKAGKDLFNIFTSSSSFESDHDTESNNKNNENDKTSKSNEIFDMLRIAISTCIHRLPLNITEKAQLKEQINTIFNEKININNINNIDENSLFTLFRELLPNEIYSKLFNNKDDETKKDLDFIFNMFNEKTNLNDLCESIVQHFVHNSNDIHDISSFQDLFNKINWSKLDNLSKQFTSTTTTSNAHKNEPSISEMIQKIDLNKLENLFQTENGFNDVFEEIIKLTNPPVD